MSRTDTDRLRELLEAASALPWCGERGRSIWMAGKDGKRYQGGQHVGMSPCIGNAYRAQDIDLIVAAVNALPALLDCIDGIEHVLGDDEGDYAEDTGPDVVMQIRRELARLRGDS